jgi:hypothetical protein
VKAPTRAISRFIATPYARDGEAWKASFAFEKILVLPLLVELGWAPRVEGLHFFEVFIGQLVQMTNEMHELPGVLIVAATVAPGRHSGEAHAVLDDPVEFAVAQTLSD